MSDTEDIRISDEESLARLAHEAAAETEGIYAAVPGITDAINRNILGRPAELDGIRVGIDEDDRATLDMYVEVIFGSKIPSVAWKLQENVKKKIETETGFRVEHVNVHVQRIHFDEE